MPIEDTEVSLWQTDISENLPRDSETINSELGNQFRNIKSAYRNFSVNKIYENHRITPTNTAPYGNSGLVVYTFPDDVRNLFEPGRKFIARNPVSFEIAPGYVAESLLINNSTYVYAIYGFGWSTSKTELLLGTNRITPRTLPVDSIGGVFAYGGSADRKVTVEFANASTNVETTKEQLDNDTVPSSSHKVNIGTTFTPRSLDYHVHIQPCKIHSEALGNVFTNRTNGLYTPYRVKKLPTYTGFEVHFLVAPEANKYIYFDWVVTFPEYN